MEENNNVEVKENLQEEINKENEGIKISNAVVAVIAGVAVSEVRGVASMQGGFAGGIGEVLSGKKNLAKGIKVDNEDGKVKIGLYAAKCDDWRKNMFTQMAAVALIDNSILDMVPLNDTAKEFAKTLNI